MCRGGGVCLFYQGLSLVRCATDNASDALHHSPGLFLGALLDDLHHAQMRPKPKSRASLLACENGAAKDRLNRRNMCSQLINAQQQRTIQRTLTHLLKETPNQRTVTATPNDTSEPQASRDTNCQGQPSNAPWYLTRISSACT